MTSISRLPDDDRANLLARLKKIEGQARGIQKMIDDGRECADVLNQVASIKAAVNGLSGELLEAVAMRCIRHPEEFGSPEQAIGEAVRTLIRSGR
jgi:CsoR family transcriptional regulator, copper-sensing transcriptional repressor